MNRDDVLRLAEANGIVIVGEEMIERFFRAAYAAGAAAEREECAKMCDGWTQADGDLCAAAIRARGEK